MNNFNNKIMDAIVVLTHKKETVRKFIRFLMKVD
jgi:hypothetical protein